MNVSGIKMVMKGIIGVKVSDTVTETLLPLPAQVGGGLGLVVTVAAAKSTGELEESFARSAIPAVSVGL